MSDNMMLFSFTDAALAVAELGSPVNGGDQENNVATISATPVQKVPELRIPPLRIQLCIMHHLLNYAKIMKNFLEHYKFPERLLVSCGGFTQLIR